MHVGQHKNLQALKPQSCSGQKQLCAFGHSAAPNLNSTENERSNKQRARKCAEYINVKR